MSDYVPYQGSLTIEELVDSIQTELTISCALPKTLPDAQIRQIIEKRALPWFYRSYQLIQTFQMNRQVLAHQLSLPPKLNMFLYRCSKSN